MDKKITLIVGSLRTNSFNFQMANYVKGQLENKGIVANILDYKNVPMFNQDIEWPAPSEVEAVRNEVKTSDAIAVFSPVYNSQVPGVLKNLIDWLSRSLVQGDTTAESAIHNKKIAISSAAFGDYAKGVEAQLTDLFKFIRTEVVATNTLSINPENIGANGDLALTDEEKAGLDKMIEELVKNI